MYITFKSEKTVLKVGQGFSLADPPEYMRQDSNPKRCKILRSLSSLIKKRCPK
ncbi:MAG: hypothetical protein L3J17_01890 [Candidatus Jettenia sp.]|nr:MAG: hypothetical protein L3J17_01890 [Candidatus Jettenia sp.]